MKKVTFNNIFWIILIVFIAYEVYGYASDYFIIKNYQYGEKYNTFRIKNEIPIIKKEMEPLILPVDNYWGMIWSNENKTTKKTPLIHRIKIINATEKDGWKSENDSFLFFINDTTNYKLNIDCEKSNAKINFKYSLTKVDSRKKNFEDYQENKYKEYSEKKLNNQEADSIKNNWKIK